MRVLGRASCVICHTVCSRWSLMRENCEKRLALLSEIFMASGAYCGFSSRWFWLLVCVNWFVFVRMCQCVHSENSIKRVMMTWCCRMCNQCTHSENSIKRVMMTWGFCNEWWLNLYLLQWVCSHSFVLGAELFVQLFLSSHSCVFWGKFTHLWCVGKFTHLWCVGKFTCGVWVNSHTCVGWVSSHTGGVLGGWVHTLVVLGGWVHTLVVCWMGEFTHLQCVGWVSSHGCGVGWVSSHRCGVLGGWVHADVMCWVDKFTQMWCVGWVSSRGYGVLGGWVHADEVWWVGKFMQMRCVGWVSSHRCNVLGG